MPDKFADVTQRRFSPVSLPGLSNKARDAVNEALEAMSDWRVEAADDNERNSKKVIDKMAAAANALGWPEQIVDAARVQMQSIAKMQIQAMDQMMDAWEEQLKLPTTAPTTAMLSKLKSLPGSGQTAIWPGASAFQTGNPMQFWMQFAEQSQKAWQDMMTLWTKTGEPRRH